MNNESLDDTRKSLEDWADTWDKACEEGIFDDVKPQEHEPINLSPFDFQAAGVEEGGQTGEKSLEDWASTWDKACEEGIFDDEPKPAPEPQAPAIFDAEGDAKGDVEGDPELLQERKTPNPVWPDSVGKDQEHPKPVWVSEEIVKEIEGLKDKLFKLENKLAKDSGDFIDQATGDKKVMSQIESMRKQIDQMSSSLGIKDEPSPWETDEK